MRWDDEKRRWRRRCVVLLQMKILENEGTIIETKSQVLSRRAGEKRDEKNEKTMVLSLDGKRHKRRKRWRNESWKMRWWCRHIYGFVCIYSTNVTNNELCVIFFVKVEWTKNPVSGDSIKCWGSRKKTYFIFQPVFSFTVGVIYFNFLFLFQNCCAFNCTLPAKKK